MNVISTVFKPAYFYTLKFIFWLSSPASKTLGLFRSENILATAAGGGHLAELFEGLSDDTYNKTTFIIPKEEHIEKISLGKSKAFIINPGRNPFLLLGNAFYSIKYLVKYKPAVIISSGAGLTYPLMLFGRLLGAKIIFIESLSQVNKPTLTGILAYPISHLYIVQSPNLLNIFPKAVLGTSV